MPKLSAYWQCKLRAKRLRHSPPLTVGYFPA